MAEKTVGSSFNYVEPLDFNLDSISNKIVYPYEDYSISVNLEVQIPDRNSCGLGMNTVLYASSDNGTISFFGGSNGGYSDTTTKNGDKEYSKGYLSTSWTDISAHNIDSGNKECLGIESINISYNQNFFPIVNIRFVDVRGASLFMPQEQAYTEALKNTKEATLSINGGSFFKALFSCPSPIFKLTVKGFYGYSSTYKLMWTKFTSDFDSENGNFVANVEFAGYLYGIYTDLPMAYISLAPYTDIGSAYWEAQVKDNRFVLDNNAKILKFPELYEKVQVFNKEKGSLNPASFEGSKLTEITDKRYLIENLIDTYPFREWTIGENNDYFKTMTFNDNGFHLIYEDNNVNTNNIESYKKYLDDACAQYPETFKSYRDNFLKLLDAWHYNENLPLTNISTSGHVIPECYIFSVDSKTHKINSGVRGELEIIESEISNENNFTLTIEFSSNKTVSFKEIDLSQQELLKKLNEFGLTNKEIGGNYAFLYCHVINTDFLKNIKKDLEEFTKKEKEEKDIIFEDKRENLGELIGFNLSIENMFRTVFAHMETFMYVYYTYLENIKNEQISGERTLSSLGISENILADVPSSFHKVIPPFPDFVKTDENNRSVLQWPEIIMGHSIQETELVRELHRSVNSYAKAVQEAQEYIKNFSLNNFDTKSFLPLTPYDILNNVNPYEECVSDLEETKNFSVAHIVNKITYIFLIRCYYFALIFRAMRTLYQANDCPSDITGLGTGNDIFKYIGAIEASNLYKAFGNRNIGTEIHQRLAKLNLKNFADKYFNVKNTDKNPIEENISEKYWNTKKGIGYKTTETIENNNYLAIPINDFYDVTGRNREGFLYIRTDNKPVTDLDVNNKFATIIEDKSFLTKIGDGIKGDETLNEFVSETDNYSAFIDNFYNKYLGDYLTIKNNDYINSGYYNPNPVSKSDIYDEAYYYSDKKDNYGEKIGYNVFSYEAEFGKYDRMSFVKCIEGGDYVNRLSLQVNDKFYTSFINNHPCIDTINVITSGCSSETSHEHFVLPEKQFFSLDSLLNVSSATKYDKAFLFLFTLPIRKEYSYNALIHNGKSVAKAVLLREGAYYYWKENFDNIISHYNEKYFKNIGSDNVPIIENSLTKDKNEEAPTLFVEENGTTFLTWKYINGDKELPEVSSSRKNCLLNYFLAWVNEVFEELNENISIENKEENRVVLNQSKLLILMKIMSETSIFFDASDIIDIENTETSAGYTSTNKETYYYGYLQKAFAEFSKNVTELYKSKENVGDILENKFQSVDDLSEDFFLSTYNTLQSLYNKHIAGSKKNRWIIGDKESDFNNFLYLDTYYTKIGDTVMVSSDSIDELMSRFVSSSDNNGKIESSFSVYEFLSLICQKTEMNLIALPIKPDLLKMDEIFKPKSFGQDSFNQSDDGCFIALYTHPNSKYLDMEDTSVYGYKNDSFLIVDENGNISSQLPIALTDADKKIPAFGVTYAKQNQCFFKRINVSSAQPQVTAPSIQAQLNIASRANDGPNETISYGQDIYSVYSNHAYTCDVEMMGCAQIIPMMYFQLNNIPMFRGTYMVINVEHNIVAGNMTTKFTGVRINKNALPYVKDTTIFNKIGEPLDNSEQIGVETQAVFEISWEDNPTKEELQIRKNNIGLAFDQTFSCIRPGMDKNGEMESFCARYTYNMAYTYKTGKTPCRDNEISSLSAGGNANSKSYWKKLEALGYKKQREIIFKTKEEINNYIKNAETNKEFSYGDILVYWAMTGGINEKTSHIEYGHTQIYIGDARQVECLHGWASSMKDNYKNSFVYGGRSGKNWKLIVFKANGKPKE